MLGGCGRTLPRAGSTLAVAVADRCRWRRCAMLSMTAAEGDGSSAVAATLCRRDCRAAKGTESDAVPLKAKDGSSVHVAWNHGPLQSRLRLGNFYERRRRAQRMHARPPRLFLGLH